MELSHRAKPNARWRPRHLRRKFHPARNAKTPRCDYLIWTPLLQIRTWHAPRRNTLLRHWPPAHWHLSQYPRRLPHHVHHLNDQRGHIRPVGPLLLFHHPIIQLPTIHHKVAHRRFCTEHNGLSILRIWISRTTRRTRPAHRNTQPHQTPSLTHPRRDWFCHCHPHQILHPHPPANPPALYAPHPLFHIASRHLLIAHRRSLSSHRLSQPPALRQHLTHRIPPRHPRPKRRLSRLYTHADLHRLLRPALQHGTGPHLLFPPDMPPPHRLSQIQIIASKRSTPLFRLHPDPICPPFTHDRLARRILVGTALFAPHPPLLYLPTRRPRRYQMDALPHRPRLLRTTPRRIDEPLSFYALRTGQKNRRDNLRAPSDGRFALFAQSIPHYRRLLPAHLGNPPPHNRGFAQLHHLLWHRTFRLRISEKLRPHRHVVGQCPAHKYPQPNNDPRAHPRRNLPHTHRHLLSAHLDRG